MITFRSVRPPSRATFVWGFLAIPLSPSWGKYRRVSLLLPVGLVTHLCKWKSSDLFSFCSFPLIPRESCFFALVPLPPFFFCNFRAVYVYRIVHRNRIPGSVSPNGSFFFPPVVDSYTDFNFLFPFFWAFLNERLFISSPSTLLTTRSRRTSKRPIASPALLYLPGPVLSTQSVSSFVSFLFLFIGSVSLCATIATWLYCDIGRNR